jgi:putative ABC transport system permease protein
VLNLPFLLARRFARGRLVARSSVIAFFIALFVTAMYITLNAFTLSGDQVVERDLGRFDARADLSGVAQFQPGDGRVVQALDAMKTESGASELDAALNSVDLRPAVIAPPVTYYQERSWTADPFPGRIALVRGRWPTRSGEVVVTNPQTLGLKVGDPLPVLAGRARFRVVGVASDRYAGWS